VFRQLFAKFQDFTASCIVVVSRGEHKILYKVVSGNGKIAVFKVVKIKKEIQPDLFNQKKYQKESVSSKYSWQS